MNTKPHQSLRTLMQQCAEVVMKTSLLVGGFDDKLVPVYTSAKYFVQSRRWRALAGSSAFLEWDSSP